MGNSHKNLLVLSSSKIVSGSHALPPRWPLQCSCVVIESSFDPGERLQAPGSLWFYLYLDITPVNNLPLGARKPQRFINIYNKQ